MSAELLARICGQAARRRSTSRARRATFLPVTSTAVIAALSRRHGVCGAIEVGCAPRYPLLAQQAVRPGPPCARRRLFSTASRMAVTSMVQALFLCLFALVRVLSFGSSAGTRSTAVALVLRSSAREAPSRPSSAARRS